jgi:L-phenylalanine/L-methionine N-acetyltransferase
MTITIRRSTTADAAAMARLMGDPEILPNLLQVPYTSTEIWQQRLADDNAPGKTGLLLVAELDGEVVANAGLHSASTQVRRRHCAGLGIAVARRAQGQGVGTALMQAVCDYADHWAQLLRIELSVFTDNERAIRLYERFGFVHEGTHRGYALRAGVYADVHSMARLHPHPPTIR